MASHIAPLRPGLAAFAKLVVLSVLVLIFLGGLVTSWGAGMAVPDWPLSFGSLNPNNWWSDFPTRLEHGHRLFASLVGLLTMLLCAWTWRNKPLIWTAAVFAAILTYSFFAGPQHAQHSSTGIMHIGFWVAGVILFLVGLFTLVLLKTSKPALPGENTVRWITYWAFVAVCVQATLGGLRVTGQTGGAMDLALALRIFHGCVAQGFLCLVVASATLLSPSWLSINDPRPAIPKLRRLAWLTVGTIFLQLIIGAAMRHQGAGLAIPTFPAASPTGSWLPAQHDKYTDVNFTHTRIGAFMVFAHIVALSLRVFRTAGTEPRLTRVAACMLALMLVQITLGVFVILHSKPPTLTTFHVLNGAAILALSVLLALRLRRFAPPSPESAQAVSYPSEPVTA